MKKQKEQTRGYVIRKSGWSGFSVLLYIILGILVPLALIAHVAFGFPKFTVKFTVRNVEITKWVILGVALLIFIVGVCSVTGQTRKARRTQYILKGNVIECVNVRGEHGKKFVLAKDSTVKVTRSLKGLIFGYGSIKLTPGNGLAGSFKMRAVGKVKAAKTAILNAISQYGKRGADDAKCHLFPFNQGFPMPYAQMPMMPCATCPFDEDDFYFDE